MVHHTWLTCVVILALGIAALAIQAEPPSEYAVKSVFLFNFAKFVEWPATAFADEHSPIVIGVLGEDPFGPYLDQTVEGELVNGRTLVVRRYEDIKEIDTCHILFISRSKAARIEDLLAALQNRPILTVADGEDSSWYGVIIRFASEGNKVRLKVNVDAADDAGLVISSKLLKLAEIIKPGEEE